jgi:hypothetical protein
MLPSNMKVFKQGKDCIYCHGTCACHDPKQKNSLLACTCPIRGNVKGRVVDLSGLSVTTTSSSKESVLTLKKLQKAFDYLKSKKYQKLVLEQERLFCAGQNILYKAWDQGIITLEELANAMHSLVINGMLVVPPAMAKKLRKVK